VAAAGGVLLLPAVRVVVALLRMLGCVLEVHVVVELRQLVRLLVRVRRGHGLALRQRRGLAARCLELRLLRWVGGGGGRGSGAAGGVRQHCLGLRAGM
jgi:hypothetical protein